MRAIVCSRYGPPETLTVAELPAPEVGDGEIRVRVHAAPINFPDTLIIEGRYQVKPPMPFSPGFEVAGEVVAVGAGVQRFRLGDRVMALMSAGYGGFAEEAVTAAASAMAIPEGMDYVTAAAFLSPYGTSYYALVQRGRLQPGETLLVLGAAGGVGIAATEIGKALGARVIAAAGSPEKLALARAHGADEGIDYRSEDLGERILELTEGRGVDVCLDGVGGDAFDAVSRRMAWRGRLLVVGFASGRIPMLPTNLPLLKGYDLAGIWWDPFAKRDPAANEKNFRQLTRLYAEGRLSPEVARTYPLEDVAEALGDVRGRDVLGKLVLQAGGDQI
jgi:NADPH2:quinone reductase